jgi:hypothetical protein
MTNIKYKPITSSLHITDFHRQYVNPATFEHRQKTQHQPPVYPLTAVTADEWCDTSTGNRNTTKQEGILKHDAIRS